MQTSLSPETNKRLESAVERMPAFPKSVQKILELSRNVNCTPKEIIEVIEKDPVMSIKVLKVINSAYFSLPYKITSLDRAVVYIGHQHHQEPGAVAGSSRYLAEQERSRLRHGRLPATLADIRRHRAPAGAPLCAGRYRPYGTVISWRCCMDFGKVVLAQFMPEEFKAAMKLSSDSGKPLYLSGNRNIGREPCRGRRDAGQALEFLRRCGGSHTHPS